MQFWSSVLTCEMSNRNKILRGAKGLGLEGHLFQTHCLSIATKKQLAGLWPGSFWVSPGDGDSAVSLSNLCQFLVILRVKKVLRGNLRCFSLCLLPLVLSVGTTEKNPGCAFFALSLQVFIYFDEIILSLLQGEQSDPASVTRRVPVPSWSLWPFDGLSPVRPCLYRGCILSGPRDLCMLSVLNCIFSDPVSFHEGYISLASVFKSVFCILGCAKAVLLVCTSCRWHGKISFELNVLFQWK